MVGHAELTASSHVFWNEPWEARSAGIATNSVVTFCIHTDISAPLTFINVYKEGGSKFIVMELIFEVAGTINFYAEGSELLMSVHTKADW